MSRKQEIYAEMLIFAIPIVRNIQTWPWWSRLRMADMCYQETELVHNLSYSILEPEFTDHDIWFLNVQARNYWHNGRKSYSYSAQVRYIRELFELVPETMRDRLLWSGPQE